AYEILSKGLPRFSRLNIPKIYSVQLTRFDHPYFKLMVHCIDGEENLIHEIIPCIGHKLKTHALNTSIRLKRYGPLTVDDCLAYPEWNLKTIMDNMGHMTNKISQKSLFTSAVIQEIPSETMYIAP
ncbi:MAG: synthase member 2, partial [Paramarteilia canceri]